MAIEWNTLVGLLYMERLGAHMETVATLGRQSLTCSSDDIWQILHAAGKDCQESAINDALSLDGGFCEALFQYLWPGCRVESFDNSAYEGASVVHDLNTALPAEYKQRYDVVIDGGTLEHVFHYPNAIKNSLEMPRKGGFFVTSTPANNAMGHGFYQFGPELFFRLLSAENGYELCDIFAFDFRGRAPWYRVLDPAAVGRVEPRNRHIVYLLAIARRVDVREILAVLPQQSLYSRMWAAGAVVDRLTHNAGFKDRIPGLLKRALSRVLRILRTLYFHWRPFDRGHYRRVNPFSLITPAWIPTKTVI